MASLARRTSFLTIDSLSIFLNLSKLFFKMWSTLTGCFYSRMFHAVLVFNKQAKMRLQKWYSCECDRDRFTKSIAEQICTRDKSFSSILEYLGYKIVYKKFASLFFAVCIDMDDNEFDSLNIIGLFVEMLDSEFGSVCELDMIFQFERSYQILDEILLAGYLQESSKTEVSFLISLYSK